MAKYLVNMVCIIGIAGAAHAVPGTSFPVANLEVTEDGHAYLVFTDGDGDPLTQSNLAGYEIKDTRDVGSTVTFQQPGPSEDGTGQYASVWRSLCAQGPLVGEENPGVCPHDIPGGPNHHSYEDWFFDGVEPLTDFLGDGNQHGYLTRAPGTPVYIGKILNEGTLVEADFLTGGWIKDNLMFRAVAAIPNPDYDPGEPVSPENLEFLSVVSEGDIVLREPAALSVVEGETALTGAPYMQTGLIGASGTDFDAAYIQSEAGDKVIIDLKVDVAGTPVVDGLNTTTTTKFYGAASGFGDAIADGHVMVNGKVVEIAYADLVETVVTASGDLVSAPLLRIQAVDGDTTIAINANLTQIDIDTDPSDPHGTVGRWGTLGSSMLVSLVPGDFDFNGHCDGDDIDLITALVLDERIPGTDPVEYIPAPAIAGRSLLFDVNQDGAVDDGDREMVIGALVEWSYLNPETQEVTSGNGTSRGDINLDGRVTIADYTLWGQYFGPDTDWLKGDLNGDGMNTIADYTLWGQYFGTGPMEPGWPGWPAPEPTGAPEPATMTLLAIGGLALLRRRRRVI